MRLRSLRIAVAAIFAGGALAVIPAQASLASGPEGCIVTAPANPQYANPCKYTATSDGGIVGGGSFKVTIVRGKKKINYTDKQGNNWMLGTIVAGDKVTAKVTSAQGFVAVGNPTPTAG